ncbi:cytochrome b5 [Neoconidiobolus thromboides FSU 785]|nr:cytochrome b5 [Neoconidiobolus thromboides FSU 785]
MSELRQRKEEHRKEIEVTKEDLNASSTTPRELIRRFFTWLGFVLICNVLASYLITESFTWGYKNKYTNWRTYIPRKQITFTPKELAKYDGTNPDLPIYIAIDGEVYDVTNGKMYYGKGGSYHFFSGKDAARAYVTGCFKTHLTHDLRGLDEHDIEGVKDWQEFYRNHETYYKIGNVIHEPIDPDSPIPEDCKVDGKRKASETVQNANKS